MQAWSHGMPAAAARRLRFALAGMLLAAAPALSLAQAMAKVGDAVSLPEITLLDGRTLPAGHYAGKPVVIEYWASWCPFCARQNPHLQKLTDATRGKGLEVLAISIDKQPGEARDYLAKHAYTFDAAMETDALRAVFGKRRVIPEIFVIDAQGKLAEIIPGEMFEEDVLELARYAKP